MLNLKKIVDFYKTPLVISQLLNVLFFLFLGSYLEEYEGFFSTAIEGIFTKPAKIGWDSDTHFLLIYLYRYIAAFTENINSYGVILLVYSWCSLSFLGCVVYRIFKINLPAFSLFLFILLYSILSIDNMINLNSVRQAFILTAAVLGYIESRRLEHKLIEYKEWIALSCILLFAALIRFDAVLLFSLLYIVLLVIFKRFYKLSLIPLLIGASIYIIFNVTSALYSSKEKKVLIYKEREIFDRYNIDYNRLSTLQQLNIDAIMQFYITDKEHFSIKFYDEISRQNSYTGALSIFNGFNIDSFGNSLLITLRDVYSARYFLLFYFLSGLVLFHRKSTWRKRYFAYYIFIALFPLLLCIYTVVPLRFLVPYFSIAGCLNIMLFSANNTNNRFTILGSLLILSFIVSNSYAIKNVYLDKVKKIAEFSEKLSRLSNAQSATKPLVINSIYPISYFPVLPMARLQKHQAVFLNFYLFSADDYQIQTWKELCHCNTFSLVERINYLVLNQNYFLIDDKAFEFLQHFLFVKYKISLQRTIISDFDGNLKVCTLKYDGR